MAVKKVKRAAARAVKDVKATVSISIQTKAVLPESATKQKLPRGTVSIAPGDKLAINVEKLSRSLIRDQRARMVSSMGCVSNPGGPGC